jgi:hypothetical protein
MACAEAALANISVETSAQMMMVKRLMKDMS